MDSPLNADTAILLTTLTPYFQVNNKTLYTNKSIGINQFWYFLSVEIYTVG